MRQGAPEHLKATPNVYADAAGAKPVPNMSKADYSTRRGSRQAVGAATSDSATRCWNSAKYCEALEILGCARGEEILSEGF